jgi:hypothetical protein
MNVRVLGLVETYDAVDYVAGLLCRGGRVEIDEPLTVGGRLEDREVLPDHLYV